MAPQNDERAYHENELDRKERVRALHKQAQAMRALTDPIHRSLQANVYSTAGGDSDRVVAFIKLLMRDQKFEIPKNLTVPDSESETMQILKDLPDYNPNSSNIVELEPRLRICLATAIAAKRMGSVDLGERVAKEVVDLKHKLENLHREPAERSLYQCVNVFRELFKDATEINALLLENYTQLGQDDAYACCRSQATRLQHIFRTMEPQVNSAAKSLNVLAVAQIVLEAVRHLGEDRIVCCDTSRLENPVLLQNVLKFPKTIIGATHYLTKLIRMYEHWNNQSESKLKKYTTSRGDASTLQFQSLPKRQQSGIHVPKVRIDEVADDGDPAARYQVHDKRFPSGRDRNAERLRLCAEWGKLKREQIEKGDQYITTDRVYTPESEPTPEERQKWRDLRDKVADMIRLHQALGEARRVQAAIGSSTNQLRAGPEMLPERTLEDQRKWQDMQERVSEMVRLYAALGQEKVARIEQGDQDAADRSFISATAPTAEQVHKWRDRQCSVAEMLRLYEALGQEKITRMQNGQNYVPANQIRPTREPTAEERQKWRDMRERVSEMLRLYTEMGLQKRIGPAAVHRAINQSRRERSPAESLKWIETQSRVADMLRLYAELGQDKVAQIEQSEQRLDPNRTIRERTPDEQRLWKDRQDSVAQMLRVYAAIGEEKRRQTAAPDDNTANVSLRGQRTAEERQKWQDQQERVNEMIRLYQALGQEKRIGRSAQTRHSAIAIRPERSVDDLRRMRETQEGVENMLRLYAALGRERKARSEQGSLYEDNAEFRRFAERTPEERANWINTNKNMFKTLEQKTAEGRARVARLNRIEAENPLLNRSVVERTEAEREQWRNMNRNMQKKLDEKAREGQMKLGRNVPGQQFHNDSFNQNVVQRSDADQKQWRIMNRNRQQVLDRIAAEGQEKAARRGQDEQYTKGGRPNQSMTERVPLDPQKWREANLRARQGIAEHAERGALKRSGLPLRRPDTPAAMNMSAVEMSPAARNRLLQRKNEEIARAAERGKKIRQQMQHADVPVYVKRSQQRILHESMHENIVVRDILSNGQIRERHIQRQIKRAQQQQEHEPQDLHRDGLPVPISR